MLRKEKSISDLVDKAWQLAAFCTFDNHGQVAIAVADALIEIVDEKDSEQLRRLSLVLLGTQLSFSTFVSVFEASLSKGSYSGLNDEQTKKLAQLHQKLANGKQAFAGGDGLKFRDEIATLAGQILIESIETNDYYYLSMTNPESFWECNVGAEHVLDSLYKPE